MVHQPSSLKVTDGPHHLYSITFYKQLWFLVFATSAHISHKITIASIGVHVINNLCSDCGLEIYLLEI